MDLVGYVPWIVVPLFRPDGRVRDALRRLVDQAPVVAVDDGSPPAYAAILGDIADLPGVTLLRSEENKGIAAALNAATSYATENGATLVVFFDQDSRPDERYIDTVQETISEAGHSLHIGALGPWEPNRYAGPPRRPSDVTERYCLIQSGMAVPDSALRAVGNFDESLFIDGVDTDFCLRLRSAGWRVGASPRLIMEHRLGVGAQGYRHLRLGPFRPPATFHGADRRYYINRNMIHLLRRYARSEPRWAAFALRKVVGNNLAALLLEDERWRKTRAILAGLVDGMRGVVGPRKGSGR